MRANITVVEDCATGGIHRRDDDFRNGIHHRKKNRNMTMPEHELRKIFERFVESSREVG